MKVRELQEFLSKHDSEEEICVLIWTKKHFDYDENDEVYLSDESWLKVVHDFEESAITSSIDEWLSDAALEHSVVKEAS